MRIAVLGPLRVTEGGRAIGIGGPRQRTVLAFLALHANQIVPSERLVDDLWGVPAPAGAGNALQAAVSRLRKVLPTGRLVTTTAGYLLRLTPEELDLSEFEQALVRGTRALADAPGDAAVILRSALSLWHGPALADFRFEPFAQGEIARLEEAHLACREARIDADLALGAGADLVAELHQLVAEHPLREKLTGQLMLALYRSGRQAEALEAFRRTRDLLAEELGIDPSQTLARLETAMLRQERWLEGSTAGEPAAGPVAAASRRPVTVVCLDVVAGGPGGSSGGSMDPEMLQLAGARARGVVGPVLERHGGRLLPTPGRRLFGAFGVVALHEDDAQRGAAAALECRDAVAAAPGPRLGCRVGVATAEALVSDADPLGFVGEAVVTAERLAEAAAPGQVLVSDGTYRLAAAALDAVPLGDGRPGDGTGDGSGAGTGGGPDGGPDRYLLRAVHVGARSLPVRLEAPVLGRAAELRRIEEACHLARSGPTTVFVTVTGEAGMGKTRLVHELAARLGDTATVVTGRCLPYGDGVTFWPLRELVEQLAGDGTAEAVARVLEGEPDARTVADRIVRAFGAGQAGTSDTAEIFWATRRLLEGVARRRLLVAVLEDLHWAEPTFLELVESIALQPGDVPLVVLCVARPELSQDRPDWLSAAATHLVVPLQALDDLAAATLADELARPGRLGEQARDRLVRAAGGNPLYLEQLVAAADEQASWPAADAPMPPTIQALLASRLHRLGPAEHEVLAAAAVVGKDFGTAAVAALLPRPIGDRLPWHLRTLTEKAMVQAPAAPGIGQAAPGQHSFRHILVQQATYREIPKTARAALHERLADWAEAQSLRADSQQVEILAHHLAQATVYYRELAQVDRADGLAHRAVTYLQQAAAASLTIGDAAAAVGAYERTMALLGPDDPGRPAVLTGLGTALTEAGRLQEARAVLDHVLRLTAGSPAGPVHAHALVQSLQLDLHLDPDGAVDRVERSLPAVRAAFLQAADDEGLCRAWLLEAAVHWHRASSAAAERAWNRAADAARAAGDRRHLTRSLRWLASAALWGPTPAGEGIARCRAYLREIGSTPTGQGVISLHMSGLHAMSGDLTTARDLRQRGTAMLREVGTTLPLVLAEPAALVAVLVEDLAAAERHLRGAFDALVAMGEQADLSTCAAMLARVVAMQGADGRGAPVPGFERWDEVAEYVHRSRTSSGGQDLSARIVRYGALARQLAARGAFADAVERVERAIELADGTDLVNQQADAFTDRAHVLALAGRHRDAVSAARTARALYLRKENRLAARQCDRFLRALE